MHDRVDRLRAQSGSNSCRPGIAGERVEHLAGIGDVGDERAGLRIVERLGVEVEDLVAVLDAGTCRACLPALPLPPVKTTRFIGTSSRRNRECADL